MEALGVVPDTMKWSKSYLDYRVIETKVGDSRSDKITTYNQLSEGSPLCSTIFLIAICDINAYLEFSKSSSFADDQVKTTTGKNLDGVIKKAEADANRTVEYFEINKFAIQPAKTSMIVISPNKAKKGEEVQIKVDGEIINEQDNFKMFGYYVDKDLNNETHANYIIKKARKMLAAIKRLVKLVPKEAVVKVLK